MAPLKTPCDLAADAAVRDHLHGRTMPPILFDAIVWAVAMRISGGKLPVLDQTLTSDIDNHAVAARARLFMPIQPAPSPIWHGEAMQEAFTGEGA